ncbi:MAG: HK97 gp10 family phage protein [Anaerotignum sp.]|nr:HK97 gp10 family phage protein [Anaerotignum sp.]
MNELGELDRALGKMLDKLPEKRRELVENAGEKMYQKVLRNIDRDTEAKTGHLREACYKHIGSEGGYAAVRNDNKKAPHAHLVEFGHRLIKGAKTKEGKHGQRVNIKGSGKVIGWVNGKHMYRNAINELEDELEQDAENMIEQRLKEAGLI